MRYGARPIIALARDRTPDHVGPKSDALTTALWPFLIHIPSEPISQHLGQGSGHCAPGGLEPGCWDQQSDALTRAQPLMIHVTSEPISKHLAQAEQWTSRARGLEPGCWDQQSDALSTEIRCQMPHMSRQPVCKLAPAFASFRSGGLCPPTLLY